MILYKYREDNENTEKIFTDKKVWLSNALGLNDPFECSIQEIAKDWINNKILESKQGHISGFVHSAQMSINKRSDFYGLTPKQTKEYLKKFLKRDFGHQYESSRDFITRKTGRITSNPNNTYMNFDKQLNEVGIFSLSETSLDQLMWSHYGGNSKGIALGFEVKKGNKLANKDHCLKVNYSDILPKHNPDGFLVQVDFMATGENIQRICFNDPTLQLAIATKPTCWSYEREWRYVEEKSGLYNYPGKLKEIVFGLNCKQDVRQKYLKLISNHLPENIEIYEITNEPNTNQINRKKLPLAGAVL
ncbi:DUF2971 domain-containing protein [Sunxiuqinia elliptica]|nr:DUF2971 domain-containing protein [Sunxiuqinia elliptica]